MSKEELKEALQKNRQQQVALLNAIAAIRNAISAKYSALAATYQAEAVLLK